MAAIPGATPAQPVRESQPPGLFALFGTEACERFSYYGMRALLVLYLTKHLNMPRTEALGVLAVYAGLVYLAPFFGGLLADKLLGTRTAVLIGACLMALGHLAMASEQLLYPALGLLITGNGFFKPNISTIVGGLYREGDPRRDGGFTIFYMGINLGAFLAPYVCGTLGEHVGWHYGFSAAAFGMVGGLMLFVWGQKLIARIGLPPARAALDAGADLRGDRLTRADFLRVGSWTAGVTAGVFLIVLAWGPLGPLWDAVPQLVKLALALAGIAGMLVMLFKGASNREESQRLLVICILCFFNIFFWLGFEQAPGTMSLFADQKTELALGWGGLSVVALITLGAGVNIWRSSSGEATGRGLWLGLTLLFVVAGAGTFAYGAWQITQYGRIVLVASQFQAINPLLIVALAPTFSRMWTRLDEGRFATSTGTKMAIGMCILGLGFVVLYFAQMAAQHGRVSPAWLAAVYALHTMGELCLSPIGLSMVTKLAPARVGSLAMGLWLFQSAIANYGAAKLESVVERYHIPLYPVLIASSFGAALLLWAMVPWLRRWTHGRG